MLTFYVFEIMPMPNIQQATKKDFVVIISMVSGR